MIQRDEGTTVPATDPVLSALGDPTSAAARSPRFDVGRPAGASRRWPDVLHDPQAARDRLHGPHDRSAARQRQSQSPDPGRSRRRGVLLSGRRARTGVRVGARATAAGRLDKRDERMLQNAAAAPQPARVQIRLTPADGTDRDISWAPGGDPICGWVVPNHLDLAQRPGDLRPRRRRLGRAVSLRPRGGPAHDQLGAGPDRAGRTGERRCDPQRPRLGVAAESVRPHRPGRRVSDLLQRSTRRCGTSIRAGRARTRRCRSRRPPAGDRPCIGVAADRGTAGAQPGLVEHVRSAGSGRPGAARRGQRSRPRLPVAGAAWRRCAARRRFDRVLHRSAEYGHRRLCTWPRSTVPPTGRRAI